MAELKAIRIAALFSPKEENVTLDGLVVTSERYGTICKLVGSEDLTKAASARSAKDGKLTLVAQGTDGKEYELFFETKYAQ